MDQLLDVIGDQFLRADAKIHRDGRLLPEFLGGDVFGGTNTGDLRRNLEHRVGDLAGDHVHLVAVRQRDDHVGVVGTGAFQYVRPGGVAHDGAHVEPVLQISQYRRLGVDDRDFVGFFRGEVIRSSGSDLACAENENIHY